MNKNLTGRVEKDRSSDLELKMVMNLKVKQTMVEYSLKHVAFIFLVSII